MIATILPVSVIGTISPYPTVVTVATVHQTASNMELISESGCGDSTEKITTEPTTTITADAIRKPNIMDFANHVRLIFEQLRALHKQEHHYLFSVIVQNLLYK